MGTSSREKAILQLMESAQLPASQVDSLFARAMDIDWWRRLNPHLSLETGTSEAGTSAQVLEPEPLPPDEIARHSDQLAQEGFFQTSAVLDPAIVARMRQCIEGLRNEKFPPVFSFVYDEFWQVMRTPSLTRLIGGFLGEDWRQTATNWAFYVPAAKGAGGWEPHSDDADTVSRSRLTVWIPLSEATVENGCMYVVPRDRMPPTLPPNYFAINGATRDEINGLLRAVQALPSPPGALLGWDHQLIHWGSMATGRGTPRISIAAVFVGRDESPRPGEHRIDPTRLPSFHERMRMIAEAILEYPRTEPLIRRYAGLAARLRDAVA